LVPATAAYTDDNNTTHVGMLRFGDCDISVDNAKTSAQRENANLTSEKPNLTLDRPTLQTAVALSDLGMIMLNRLSLHL